MSGARSLVGLSTADVRTLASELRAGRLAGSLSLAALQARGLGHVAEHAPWVLGLEASTLALLAEGVLAEREQASGTRLDLVWTGPEEPGSITRDTQIVVRELFESAEKSVLIAGYTFDHGEQLFRPLHRRMRERGVITRVIFEVPGRAPLGESPDAYAHRCVAEMLRNNWPFGPPFPRVFYDPRSASHDARASMHAKCLVVDARRTLITSANFTDRGQTRNIELGLLVESMELGSEVTAQWEGLIGGGWLQPAP